MSDLARILTYAGDWLAVDGSILLMTDYDGTLTPIVDDPADAPSSPGAPSFGPSASSLWQPA